jgi:tetratricopeptide (TPR) repeat protein
MLRFIILSISTLTLISNYLIFNSFRYQTVLFNDTKEESFTFSISQLNEIDYKYPSLAFNSVPILTYISIYNTENEKFNEAIDQLKESLIFNPNSSYTKYLLSRNYIFLNDFKNAERYLEEIFEASPKIESSSALYLSILEKNQNAIKLNNIYDKMIEIENKNIWIYYISALKKNTHLPLDKGLYNKALFFFKKNIDVL